MNKYIFPIICVIAFTAPLGNLSDFIAFTRYSGLGLSTILSLLLIGLCMTRSEFWTAFGRERLFSVGCVFCAFAAIGAFFSEFPLNGLTKACMFFLYILIAVSVYSAAFTPPQLTRIFIFAIMGAFCMVAVSILDFYGFIALNEVNRVSRSIVTGQVVLEESGSLSGPFRSRTEFVVYLSIVFPTAIWLAIAPGVRPRLRLVMISACALFALGAVLAGSRGFYLALGACMLFYLRASSSSRSWKPIILMGLAAIVTVGFLVAVEPELGRRFLAQLKTLQPSEIVHFRSDVSRFLIWKAALLEVLFFPLGLGLVDIEVTPGYFMQAHNFFVDVIHAGGFAGVFFVVVFIRTLWRPFFRIREYPLLVPLMGATLCFLVYNLTHSQWGTGLLWMWLGMLVFVKRRTEVQRERACFQRNHSRVRLTAPQPVKGY